MKIRTLCLLSVLLMIPGGLPPCFAEAPQTSASDAAAPASPVEERFDFADGLYARSMYDMAAAEYQRLIQEAPQHPRAADAGFRLAESFFFLEKYPEAIEHYKAWLEHYPALPQRETAQLRLADCYYNLNRKDEAAVLFQTAAQSAKPLIRNAAHYYLGKIFLEKQQYDEAKGHLEPLQNPDPENSFSEIATYYLGQIALKQNDLPKAKELFTRLETSEKSDIRELSLLGGAETSFTAKNYEEALGLFTKLHESALRPEVKEEAFLNTLRCLYELGRFQEVVDQGKNRAPAGNISRDFPVSVTVASALGQLKRYDEAVTAYENILALPGLGNREKETVELGKLEMLLQSGNTAKAAETAQAMPQERRFFKERWLYLMSEISKRSGKKEEALGFLGSLEKESQDPEYLSRAILNRAHLLIDQGDIAGARAGFDEFLSKFPDHPLARQTLANRITLDIRLDQPEEAVKSSQAFLEKFAQTPEAAEVHFQLGQLYLKLEDFPKAASAFEGHLSQFPDDGKHDETLFFLAYASQLAGSLEKAVDLYRQLAKGKLSEDLYITGLKNKAYCLVRLNKMAEAADSYHQLMREAPPAEIKADLFLWLAEYDRDHNRGKELLEALEIFKNSPEAPAQAGALDFFRGEGLRLTGQADAAAAAYEAAASAAGPWKVKALLGKARLLSDGGNLDGALQILQQAIQESRDNPEAALAVRLEIANIYEKKNLPEDAAKTYLSVAILYDDPATVPEALMKAGASFEKAGRGEEASKAYQELLQRYPEHALAAQAKAKLPRAP